MEELTIREILEAVKGRLLGDFNDLDAVVTKVETDSRTISSGALFLPLAGERFDGHAYINAALEAVDRLAQHDVIFEINTGAMSRGYRSAPYPAAWLLSAMRERGCRICITSDSHSADTIVHAFPHAAALAEAAGFRETWVLAKDGFQPVGLADCRSI